MGERSFIIIKIRKPTTENRRRKQRGGKTEKIKINLDSCLNQFCLMQYNQSGANVHEIGIAILRFLRKIMEENRWEEFVEKCRKLKNDSNEQWSKDLCHEYDLVYNLVQPILKDNIDIAFAKMKKDFVKLEDKYFYISESWRYPKEFESEFFEKITSSPETLQRVVNSTKSSLCNTGAIILDMIMNNQLDKVNFFPKQWPSDSISCEYGYLIDCTTKEFLVYSTSRRSYESKAKDTGDEDHEELSTEDPLSFLNAIDLSGRFSIDKLPSDEEFFKKWDSVYWQKRKLEKSELEELKLEELELEELELEE